MRIDRGVLTRREFVADALLFEPNRPMVNRVEIRLARLPEAFEGITIAQLSDFHYDPEFSIHPIRSSIETVNQMRPDLIVLTGDFVTAPFGHKRHRSARAKRAARAAEPCVSLFLSHLQAPLGMLAVLGNHDGNTDPDFITEVLQGHGIKVLQNTAMPLERGGARLWMCGADTYPDRGDVGQAVQDAPKNEPAILLVHEPDVADVAAGYPIDLQLSGHSHGGQVRFPAIGAPYLPPLGRKYPWGLRRVGPLTLYTNIGIGTLNIPVRWNCPPEISFFTLRRAVDAA